MNLTGNELLEIPSDFLAEMIDSYKIAASSVPNALRSTIFSRSQIELCLIPPAVGVGFVRTKNPSTLAASTPFNGLTDSLVFIVSIGADAKEIDSNGGYAALGTCPTENCPKLVPLINLREKSPTKFEIADINADRVTVGYSNLKLGAVYFSKKAIWGILAQPNCEGIMAILVEYPNRFHGLAICGIDQNSDPQKGIGYLVAYSNINV